jgi:hypothetical protein
MHTDDGNANVSLNSQPDEAVTTYDVAFSYAREDRDYVDRVAKILRSHSITVFYDGFEEAALWGKDLYVHLTDVYTKRARFCVMFLSQAYAKKAWTNHERAAAQQRAFEDRQDYILPARFDETEIPGIRSTTGYIDLRKRSPDQLATLIIQKLRTSTGPVTASGRTRSLGSRAPGLTISRTWLVLRILMIAVAMFALMRNAGARKTAVPRWLSAEFLPTLREVHRFADDLETAGTDYTQQSATSPDVFRRQLQDLAFAIGGYNGALREFRIRQDDFRAQLGSLSRNDVELGIAATNVLDYAASKFQTFPEPPRFDPRKTVGEQRTPLLSAWHSNAPHLRPHVDQLKSHLAILQCDILQRAGAPTAECQKL